MLGLNVYLSRYCLVAIVYFTLSISGCVFAFIAVAKAKKVIAPFDPTTAFIMSPSTTRAGKRSRWASGHRSAQGAMTLIALTALAVAIHIFTVPFSALKQLLLRI